MINRYLASVFLKGAAISRSSVQQSEKRKNFGKLF